MTFSPLKASTDGHRIGVYGGGGTGKTTLACALPGPVAFVDADQSLNKLRPQLIAQGIPLPVHVPVNDWKSLRASRHSAPWDQVQSVVYDTGTVIELWAVAETLLSVPVSGGKVAKSVEDYGYGKGYRHVMETFSPFFNDLDWHMRQGRHVCLICHDVSKTVPNPGGLDFLRWEPKLQDSKECSIRLRFKEWVDHLLFLQFDANIKKSDELGKKAGKAEGYGSRSLYTSELPHFMAKSRTTSETFIVSEGPFDWSQIIK